LRNGVCLWASVIAGYNNISGTYFYTGLGNYTADQFPNPLIDFADISPSSDINIVQTESLFRVDYITIVGVIAMFYGVTQC